MTEKDILQQFMFENASVRGEIVRLEESFQTIMHQHQYPPEIRHILGEMLAVVSLLSASIKFKGRVTVQFQGQNKVKLLLAQSNHELHVRALAQWTGELTPPELIQELKKGILAIIMEPESLEGNRYQGIVEFQGDSFASSIESYFAHSEQVPTRLWLAVNQHTAAGFLIQVMPHESAREKKDFHQQDWEHICHLSSTITASELLGLDSAILLRRLYVEEDVRLFAPRAIVFRCTCSLARSENALRLLGEEEAEQELNEKQKIVVTCEFCNKEFPFDRVDVARIFKEGKLDSSGKVH